MKRWGIRITICLVLGAITTIGVAWGCAINPTFPVWETTGWYLRPEGEWLWCIDKTDGVGASKLRWVMFFGDRVSGDFRDAGVLDKDYQDRHLSRLRRASPDARHQLWVRADVPSWSKLGKTPEANWDKGFRRLMEEYAYGWPALALAYRLESDMPSQRTDRSGTRTLYDPSLERYVGALHIGPSRPLTSWTGYLPLQVHWRGFVADSLLYAVGWFVPFGGIALTRLGLRRYRGKCVTCGYDLRGAEHEVCPECGASVAD